MLAVLMKTETPSKQWPLWNRADQLSVMSSRDLVEAGVLGLEDGLTVEGTESLSESASFEVTRGPVDSDDCPTEAGGVASGCREVLLKELRELHVLDELIMEENVKIHKLRRHEEERLDKKPAVSMGPRRTSKERQMFQLELQREKKEVERLEMSLDNGTTRCKLRKQLSRTRKVVKCSVMERTSKLEYLEDSALCEELISGRKRPCNTQLLTKMPPNANASNTDAVSFSESVTKQPVLQDSVSPLDSPGIYTNLSIYDSLGHVAVSSLQQPVLASRQTTPDSREEVGIQPQGYDDGKRDSRFRETVESHKPEDSSKPEPKPDYSAFDPGGSSDNPPVPKPRRTQPPVHDASTEPVHLMDQGPEPPGTQMLDTPPMPKERKTKPPAPCDVHILNADVNEHTNNNNNNKPIRDQQLLKCAAPHKPSSHVPQDDPVTSTLTQVSSQGLQIQTDLHVSQYSEIEGVEFSLKVSEPPPEVFPDPCEPVGVEVPCADIPDGFQRCGTGTGSFQQPSIHIGTREMMNYKTPIVLDTGSGLMKAGFADQDLPSTIFPTIIGLPKYEEIMNGNFERETYIGHEAQHMRGVLTLKYPMKNGIISNWDDMEKIWHHTFQQLGVEPDEHPVLLTEAAMNPRDNRQRMVELMFESFNVPLTYVAMQAVLALYAAGRSTGVVFDSGDGVSHSVPVFEGYCLPHAIQRFTMAGYDVTMHLKKLLQEQGVCMRTSAELEIAREMKEKCCCVAQDYESELTCGGSASREMHYTMPDGQVISLSTERFRAPEILFKPELIGRDHYGMHESIFKSILSSDLDLRRSFLGNIVLAGGNTLLAGLPERLQKEIRVMVPSDLGECVRVTSPKDRDFSVWSGGAVLANLPSFASAWISQEEYEEFGPQIVFRKCF
ncbi:uncharacterized protein [Osmerus mordax]|uniref:uncharacterized protein n=1 Tax=Osmerus mordax TaxID=8014 RepID=UPI0035106AC6